MANKMKVKWNLKKLRAKIARWPREVVENTFHKDLKQYANEGARLMVRCTPPGNMQISVSKGVRTLKERIKEDLMGENVEAFTEDDVQWAHDKKGNLFAYFKGTKGRNAAKKGRPGPFRLYAGKPSEEALRAMNVGRHGVRHVVDVRGWIKSYPQYYKFGRRGSSRAMRLNWTNAYRHVAGERDAKKEVRRRQKQAGMLMAGWQPLAKIGGLKLQAAISRLKGRGSARMRKILSRGAYVAAKNESGYYPGLQPIVDRQMPYLKKKIARLAKKFAKKTGKKLRKK